jgi:hypothetical protein
MQCSPFCQGCLGAIVSNLRSPSNVLSASKKCICKPYGYRFCRHNHMPVWFRRSVDKGIKSWIGITNSHTALLWQFHLNSHCDICLFTFHIHFACEWVSVCVYAREGGVWRLRFGSVRMCVRARACVCVCVCVNCDTRKDAEGEERRTRQSNSR